MHQLPPSDFADCRDDLRVDPSAAADRCTWRRGIVGEAERAKNRTKSRVRAKVGHAIGVIKRVFGFAKVRYRGLEKNAQRLFVTCALANLFVVRRYLLRRQRA